MCKNDQEVLVSSDTPGNTDLLLPPSFGRGPKGMLEMIRLVTKEHRCTLKTEYSVQTEQTLRPNFMRRY